MPRLHPTDLWVESSQSSDNDLAIDLDWVDTKDAQVNVGSQSLTTIAVLKKDQFLKLNAFHDVKTGGTNAALESVGGTFNSPELNVVWIAPGPSL